MEVKTSEKKRTQQDESVRIELTLSKEEMEIFKKAQEILSNQTGGTFKATILAMAKKTVQSMQEKPAQSVTLKPHLKTITPKLRKFIFQRDQCCQFKDKSTGKICGSKHFLEVDHITPKFAAGTNDPKNLRLLCRNHNQYRYQLGI